MIVFNATPHPIVLIPKSSCTFNPTIRKWIYTTNAYEIFNTIPPNYMLSATFQEVDRPAINDCIPVRDKIVTAVDPQPEADVIICSALYYTATQKVGGNTDKLYTVIDPVFTPDAKTILGCLAIGKI